MMMDANNFNKDTIMDRLINVRFYLSMNSINFSRIAVKLKFINYVEYSEL